MKCPIYDARYSVGSSNMGCGSCYVPYSNSTQPVLDAKEVW